jgi:ketosteroid isomerase-like protein
MSPRRSLAASLCLFIAACAPTAPVLSDAHREAVAAEVTATLTALNDAMNAHEPERVVSFYSDAPEFVALTCTSFITGGAAFKGMVGPTFGPRRGATFQQRVASIQALSATTAVVAQSGSSTRAPALFWTRVLKKQDDRWIITYEHQSWPGCPEPTTPHPATTPGDSAALRPGGISS